MRSVLREEEAPPRPPAFAASAASRLPQLHPGGRHLWRPARSRGAVLRAAAAPVQGAGRVRRRRRRVRRRQAQRGGPPHGAQGVRQGTGPGGRPGRPQGGRRRGGAAALLTHRAAERPAPQGGRRGGGRLGDRPAALGGCGRRGQAPPEGGGGGRGGRGIRGARRGRRRGQRRRRRGRRGRHLYRVRPAQDPPHLLQQQTCPSSTRP